MSDREPVGREPRIQGRGNQEVSSEEDEEEGEGSAIQQPEPSDEPDYEAKKMETYARTPVLDHIQEVIDSIDADGRVVDPSSITVGVAPHVISIAGFAFWQLTNEHRIHFPELSNTTEPEEFVKAFLGELNLQFVHKITIRGALNYSGQISYPTMAVAIWKSLATEFGICLMQDLINKLMKFDLKVEEQEAVLATVLNGSERWIQLKPERPSDHTGIPRGSVLRENDANRLSVDLIKNLSFLFVRTDLHNSTFVEKLLANEDDLREFKQNAKNAGYMEEEDLIGKTMEQYSRTRIARYGSNSKEKYECLPIEVDSYTALDKFRSTISLAGVQVQQGGVLLVMKKGEYFNGGLLEQIANDIANGSRTEISTITIDVIKLSGGVLLADQKIALDMRKETGYTFNVTAVEILQTCLKRSADDMLSEEGPSAKKKRGRRRRNA
uniref:ACT domain-containing protein n=1 Tax=Caenorhabditis tropicalis TaxID=1561998 RepID=A0A1I7USF9_9PELO